MVEVLRVVGCRRMTMWASRVEYERSDHEDPCHLSIAGQFISFEGLAKINPNVASEISEALPAPWWS